MPTLQAQLPIARATFPPDELTPAIRKLARRAERRAAKKAHEAKKRREGKLVVSYTKVHMQMN